MSKTYERNERSPAERRVEEWIVAVLEAVGLEGMMEEHLLSCVDWLQQAYIDGLLAGLVMDRKLTMKWTDDGPVFSARK
jgi:hypothetical protein